MKTLTLALSFLLSAAAFGQGYYINRTPFDHPEGQIVTLDGYLDVFATRDTFVADSFVAEQEFQLREIRIFRPQIPGFTLIGYRLFSGETWESRVLVADRGGSLFDRGPVAGSPNLLREYETSNNEFGGLYQAGKYWLELNTPFNPTQFALIRSVDDDQSIIGNRETGAYRTIPGDLSFRVGLIPEPTSFAVVGMGIAFLRKRRAR